jgi:DNA (cytosine-5)-methyltransferase 1
MKTVDLFAGCGGLSLGFEKAGFQLISAYDNWDAAVDVYQKNIKSHQIYKADLSEVEYWTSEIMKFSPSIIIGGPPCQDFSSAGKRNEKLGRADLTISFGRYIQNIRPDFFVMENVHRIVKSQTLKTLYSLLDNAGYWYFPIVLDASYCGVPQARKRYFLYGSRTHKMSPIQDILNDMLSEKPMTLRDYFGEELGIEAYYRHPRSYKRRGVFSIDEPSPTIRGVNRPIPKGYPGHPNDYCDINPSLRPLTTKERSRIQTFPSWYEWTESKTLNEQMIGNAVPVNLAYFVAKALKLFINQTEQEEIKKSTLFAYEPETIYCKPE